MSQETKLLVKSMKESAHMQFTKSYYNYIWSLFITIAVNINTNNCIWLLPKDKNQYFNKINIIPKTCHGRVKKHFLFSKYHMTCFVNDKTINLSPKFNTGTWMGVDFQQHKPGKRSNAKIYNQEKKKRYE